MSDATAGPAGHDATPQPMPDAAPADPADAELHGAIVVALVPGQSPRVLAEAVRYARLLQAAVVGVHVDVTRFVTYEDPDGFVHSAPIDLQAAPGEDELLAVRAAVEPALRAAGLVFTIEQPVGDPALAIKRIADRVHARLIVVGTRRRGVGESIREFFTGSVAARLAHRQHRPVLVVPLGDPVPDDQPDAWAPQLND